VGPLNSSTLHHFFMRAVSILDAVSGHFPRARCRVYNLAIRLLVARPIDSIRRRDVRHSWAALCAAIGVAVLAGCGSQAIKPGPPAISKTGGDSGKPGDAETSDLAGRIEADGSSTVCLISESTAVAFKKSHPKVQTQVGKTGTGGGFKRFVKGETDISDASRPMTGDEFKECQTNKVSFRELPVAYDGLSFVVNPKNTFVESLTIKDLEKVFLSDSPASTWKEVNDAWPDEPIKIHAPGKNSGTFDYFMEVMGKKRQIRTDIGTSEEDNVLVNAVKSDPNAIAFFGCAYYFSNKDSLRVVPIIDPSTKKAVEPTLATIESGEYAPFSRPLFIYVNGDSLKQPQVEAFVEFYLDNASATAKKVGYVPLPDKLYGIAKQHFEQRALGTCYLTESGEKRHGRLDEVFKKDNLRDIN
jgi:phosphate transport system substrate-binding protein